MFGLDIQSQTEIRVRKPKKLTLPPGSRFERDISENQKISVHGRKQYAHEILNWNSKATSSHAWDTMPRIESIYQKNKSNMATRLPIWRWHRWKSICFCPIPQTTCLWNLEFKFKTWVTPRKLCHLESRYHKIQYGCRAAILKVILLKINRLLIIHTRVVALKFGLLKAKLKLESGNRKIQDGHQAAILKVTTLKFNMLLPMAKNNMDMEFEIENWVTLRKSSLL